MGRVHVKQRLPRYVHAYVDRHGRARYYFRKAGHKNVPLPGLPFSTEFMDAYGVAKEGAPRSELGITKSRYGTVAAAVASYLGSWAFQILASETRRTRKNILERFRDQHGDKRIAMLRSEHVKDMMAAKARTPQSANKFLKTLRALMLHCIEMRLIDVDPTQGVKSIKVSTDGYRTWSEADIEAFEARHSVGSRARLAIALLLYTGQRRGDIVTLGRQHIRGGAIHLRQSRPDGRWRFRFILPYNACWMRRHPTT